MLLKINRFAKTLNDYFAMEYNLDFKTCKNELADEKIKEYVCLALDNFFDYYPKENVEAIVLTGAMARGEGSVAIHPDGSKRIYSDFDFMIFLKNQELLSEARINFPQWSRALGVKLREQDLCSHVDYAPNTKAWLQNVKPMMFTVEFQHAAKVVWGKKDILNDMPPLDIKQIPQIDAINLLFNRMLGQLIFLKDFESPNPNEVEFAFYHTGKVYVDLAGAILAFLGEYEPTYEMRAKKIVHYGILIHERPPSHEMESNL
jgi:hypothetical protein